MLLITILAILGVCYLTYAAVLKSKQVSELEEYANGLENELYRSNNELASTQFDLSKADEIVVNLTEAEHDRVLKRINKKKDDGKKVR